MADYLASPSSRLRGYMKNALAIYYYFNKFTRCTLARGVYFRAVRLFIPHYK